MNLDPEFNPERWCVFSRARRRGGETKRDMEMLVLIQRVNVALIDG